MRLILRFAMFSPQGMIMEEVLGGQICYAEEGEQPPSSRMMDPFPIYCL